jgi:hypothetical protein
MARREAAAGVAVTKVLRTPFERREICEMRDATDPRRGKEREVDLPSPPVCLESFKPLVGRGCENLGRPWQVCRRSRPSGSVVGGGWVADLNDRAADEARGDDLLGRLRQLLEADRAPEVLEALRPRVGSQAAPETVA